MARTGELGKKPSEKLLVSTPCSKEPVFCLKSRLISHGSVRMHHSVILFFATGEEFDALSFWHSRKIGSGRSPSGFARKIMLLRMHLCTNEHLTRNYRLRGSLRTLIILLAGVLSKDPRTPVYSSCLTLDQSWQLRVGISVEGWKYC